MDHFAEHGLSPLPRLSTPPHIGSNSPSSPASVAARSLVAAGGGSSPSSLHSSPSLRPLRNSLLERLSSSIARPSSAPPTLAPNLPFVPSGEDINPNEIRLTREYFNYYYSQQTRDPRLPPPLQSSSSSSSSMANSSSPSAPFLPTSASSDDFTLDSKVLSEMMKSFKFDGPSSASSYSLPSTPPFSAHRQEKQRSQSPLHLQQPIGRHHSSVANRIDEDFPKTPSPVYLVSQPLQQSKNLLATAAANSAIERTASVSPAPPSFVSSPTSNSHLSAEVNLLTAHLPISQNGFSSSTPPFDDVDGDLHREEYFDGEVEEEEQQKGQPRDSSNPLKDDLIYTPPLLSSAIPADQFIEPLKSEDRSSKYNRHLQQRKQQYNLQQPMVYPPGIVPPQFVPPIPPHLLPSHLQGYPQQMYPHPQFYGYPPHPSMMFPPGMSPYGPHHPLPHQMMAPPPGSPYMHPAAFHHPHHSQYPHMNQAMLPPPSDAYYPQQQHQQHQHHQHQHQSMRGPSSSNSKSGAHLVRSVHSSHGHPQHQQVHQQQQQRYPKNNGHKSRGGGGGGGFAAGEQHPASSSASASVTRSPLMEQFRADKSRAWELKDIALHINEFSRDQFGSRFIQQQLETCSDQEKQLVFDEIQEDCLVLMNDVFGNYVVQKLLEFGLPLHRRSIFQMLDGHVLELTLQPYGCRVIQKAIEMMTPTEQAGLADELRPHVVRCIENANGNHVIQKCVEKMNSPAFIIESFTGRVCEMARHSYGCRVIQRIIEHCPEEVPRLLTELAPEIPSLITNEYANYVVQHIMQHGTHEQRVLVVQFAKGRILQLSLHKYSSNVVEKCIEYSQVADRTVLIDEVLHINSIMTMVADQYANYVLQKIFDVANPSQRQKLIALVTPQIPSLRQIPSSRHLLAKLEKEAAQTMA